MADKRDKIIGKAKEMAGKLTGDEKMKSEGKTQGAKGTVKEKADKAKRSVEGAVKGVKGRRGDEDPGGRR